MSGIVNLDKLLAAASPVLREEEFVFVTLPDGVYGQHADLRPVAAVTETEGLTLVVPRSRAQAAGLPFDGVFRMITLEVHSSLTAVGLTAAVAGALAARGISANVIAAFYHDHIFVPATQATQALAALSTLGQETAR